MKIYLQYAAVFFVLGFAFMNCSESGSVSGSVSAGSTAAGNPNSGGSTGSGSSDPDATPATGASSTPTPGASATPTPVPTPNYTFTSAVDPRQGQFYQVGVLDCQRGTTCDVSNSSTYKLFTTSAIDSLPFGTYPSALSSMLAGPLNVDGALVIPTGVTVTVLNGVFHIGVSAQRPGLLVIQNGGTLILRKRDCDIGVANGAVINYGQVLCGD